MLSVTAFCAHKIQYLWSGNKTSILQEGEWLSSTQPTNTHGSGFYVCAVVNFHHSQALIFLRALLFNLKIFPSWIKRARTHSLSILCFQFFHRCKADGFENGSLTTQELGEHEGNSAFRNCRDDNLNGDILNVKSNLWRLLPPLIKKKSIHVWFYCKICLSYFKYIQTNMGIIYLLSIHSHLSVLWRIILNRHHYVWWNRHSDSLSLSLCPSCSHRTTSQGDEPWPHRSSHRQLQLWHNWCTRVWAIWCTGPKRISTSDWWDVKHHQSLIVFNILSLT